MHAQEDGRYRREPGLLERPKRLKPVESRHLDVKDDDVRIHIGSNVKCMTAICCGTDDVKVIGQHPGHGIEKLTVVIDEKNSRLRTGGGEMCESRGHGRSILSDPGEPDRIRKQLLLVKMPEW